MAKISSETKIHAVKQCYAGVGSLNEIAARFGVNRSTYQPCLSKENERDWNLSKYVPSRQMPREALIKAGKSQANRRR